MACKGVGGFNGARSVVCKGVGGFNGARSVVCKGVGGFKVAPSSRAMREKVRPARPGMGVCAKKFALQAQNGRKMLFSGVPGELFRGRATESPMLGEFFRGIAAESPVLGELFRGSAAEQPLKALTVSVRRRVGSPCGRLSSAGEKFRMQFPSRHFE